VYIGKKIASTITNRHNIKVLQVTRTKVLQVEQVALSTTSTESSSTYVHVSFDPRSNVFERSGRGSKHDHKIVASTARKLLRQPCSNVRLEQWSSMLFFSLVGVVVFIGSADVAGWKDHVYLLAK
jgi:hypothetical protein